MMNDKQNDRIVDLYKTDSKFSTDNEEYQETGSIGTFDFYIWTFIPTVGILFCLLHAHQDHFWQWTGDTVADAQSLKAKTVVSVISTVIGGSIAATFMKTVSGVSYTFVRHRKAGFSQLVTMIGGFSPSHIPMLTAGKAWFSIIVIILAVIISSITKQLAVVSMSVSLVSQKDSMLFHTRDYSTCSPVYNASSLSRMFPVINLNTLDSLRHPNHTFTNEYYDRGIPADIKGQSRSERVLPFANVSCAKVPLKADFTRLRPLMSELPSPNKSDPFGSLKTMMTLAMYTDKTNEKLWQWVNCTMSIGYANAITTCNETLCHTMRTTSITPFNQSGLVLGEFINLIFELTTPYGSNTRNSAYIWLLGADLSDYYELDTAISGESLEMVQNRAETLATVVARILCDQNTGKEYNATTTFESVFDTDIHYSYHVLWKWPFWLLSVFLFILWLICLATMWFTPESRVVSVEWLLSQYIAKNRLSYLSGLGLVKSYKGTLFQILDENAEEDIGCIVILEAGYDQGLNCQNVVQGKKYQ
ncbi:uncharacterized protein EV154DRAFT_558579 [Mucor mucedo]|uniref:uncharacterized protein n=1 Tax=Mucor mucedo TaxID=29922 RepID=UPI0022203B65|nr:uncharacterized protein EV154DRAFT_558579 [Mucor mucedo]KAI7896241.1 hypothetical protein EV154DRAFT_558579 [Mucor mucedo]